MKYMFPIALVLLSGTVLNASPVCPSVTQQTYNAGYDRSSAYEKMANEILGYINEYRRKKRLPMLEMNSIINAQAQKHSENMAAHRTSFGHNGFKKRMNTILSQVNGTRAAAENVAFGNMNARQVVEGWLQSGGHRHNIEGRYTLTGIGIAADSKGNLYFTQIFAGH
jgi:uncharacterized protein YkwD